MQDYTSLKPLNRRRDPKEYSSTFDDPHVNMRSTFGQVTQENAFYQTYEDLVSKCDPDPNL